MAVKAKSKKRIVVLGGGTGVFNVLTGLKKTGHELSAIVTMADDGGSSGVLREEFGILPPGDIRRALVALSHAEQTLADLFTYRFEEGEGLEGHSVGNLLLAALERMTGSFESAVNAAGRILQIEGSVIPVTLDDVRLKAWLKGGGTVSGEHAIDVPLGRRIARIMRIGLTPGARPNPRALEAIEKAHLIVIGPGDLYTSLLPNLVVSGIPEAIRDAAGKKVYCVNLMTKRGETDGFHARDFVRAVEKVLGKGVLDAVVVNSAVPPTKLREWYYKFEQAEPVAWSHDMLKRERPIVVAHPLLRREGKLIRHDVTELSRVLESFL